MAITLDFIDIDADGAETSSGVPVEYIGADAIKSAFRNYLTSDPGDILYFPYVGGIIQQILHKTMQGDILSSLTVAIQRQIESDFVGLTINALQFIPDYEAGVLELYVNYSAGGTQQELSLYFDKSLSQQPKYEYTYIDYVGENLKNFCLNKKSDIPSASLGLDPNLQLFRWGDYVLQNLTPLDPYFEEIFLICNSGVS